MADAPNPESKSDENNHWDWHIILNRSNIHCEYSGSAFTSGVIPLYKSENKRETNGRLTLGWVVSVYRLKSDMFARSKECSTESKGYISMEYAKKIQDQEGLSFDNDGCIYDGIEQLISSPCGIRQLLGATKHHLVEAFDCRDLPGRGKDFILKTIEILSEKRFKGVIKGQGDDEDFNMISGIVEEDWGAAVGERPKNIVLHVPLPLDVVPESELDDFTKKIHLAFPRAKVSTNRVLKDDTSEPERLLWACDLARHMVLRFHIRQGKKESESPVSGNLGYGIDEFLLHGTKLLKDLPKKPNSLEGAYYYASLLLAQRPWSIFAPFEILKVTLTKDDEETIRWVMFNGDSGSGGGGDGDSKGKSPFGSIQIQENLSDLTDHFGRTNMYLQSGMFGSHSYPDRLFVSSDPIGNVHYDTIFLLKYLFGSSISPLTSQRYHGRELEKVENGEAILDFGVVPNMEVQTGQPDAYLTSDSIGRSFSRRSLNSDELAIVPKICVYCYKFAKEHKLLGIKPSGGSFERTYPDGFSCNGGNDSVKVEYNMNQKYGGIWNAERKYMWFE
ncbi:hypothetical protein ACHAXR_010357 [Thalassiosira sp. AJA248-18]